MPWLSGDDGDLPVVRTGFFILVGSVVRFVVSSRHDHACPSPRRRGCLARWPGMTRTPGSIEGASHALGLALFQFAASVTPRQWYSVYPRVFSIMVSRSEVVADLGLLGHADAAVELDRLSADDFQDLPICTFAAATAVAGSLALSNRPPWSPTSTSSGPASSATNMSAARRCRVWKLPIGTPTAFAS